MGIGDELMAAGEVAHRAKGTVQKFRMIDKSGNWRWHFTWEGNPHIARPGDHYDGDFYTHPNGHRPYIYAENDLQRTFVPYTPRPAFLPIPYNLDQESTNAKGFVIFNPHIKVRASPNKEWPMDYWKLLIKLGSDFKWLLVDGDRKHFRGAGTAWSPTFWHACALMKHARAVVCHEGALHHAAAAIGVPTIVIRGGYISPEVTGYPGQVDMYVKDPSHPYGCGMRVPCGHCATSMAMITPHKVLEQLRRIAR
jgi:ADP-heptose:LPS heptosyltransferase